MNHPLVHLRGDTIQVLSDTKQNLQQRSLLMSISFSSLILIAAAVCEQLAAVAVILAQSAIGNADVTHGTIMGQGVPRMYCIIGALGGTFCSLGFFQPRDVKIVPDSHLELDTVDERYQTIKQQMRKLDMAWTKVNRRLAMQLFAQPLLAMALSPVTITYLQFPMNADVILAVSFGYGFGGVYVLHLIQPAFENTILPLLTKHISKKIEP